MDGLGDGGGCADECVVMVRSFRAACEAAAAHGAALLPTDYQPKDGRRHAATSERSGLEAHLREAVA
jgi:hypothetical protein